MSDISAAPQKKRGRFDWHQSSLRDQFNYTDDGTFVRKKKSGARSNATFMGQSVQGCLRSDGYRVVSIDNIRGYFHHAVFIYHLGPIPAGTEVDHVNGNRGDNRIENLRLATKHQNAWNRKIGQNNIHGETGVRWRPERNKWTGGISVQGVYHRIPHVETKAEAVLLLKNLKRRLHGRFTKSA